MNGLEIGTNGVDGAPAMAGALADFLEEETKGEDRPLSPSRRVRIVLRGIAVSPGAAQGDAVVHSRGEAYGSIRPGSILICSIMEPALIEVLPLCRGLICEQGGMLNPVAGTAREYGIPVLSAAPFATKEIVDGDRVRMDGGNGTVVLLS